MSSGITEEMIRIVGKLPDKGDDKMNTTQKTVPVELHISLNC